MSINLAKFLPPETRLRIAQSVIKEKGIRPLAREIGVNPKSVYKYKEGSANPGNEVMAKILAVAKKEESIELDEYLNELRNEFHRALELTFDPQEVLTDASEKSEKSSIDTEESSVGQKTTDQTPKETSVDDESTESMTMGRIFNEIGVTNRFNQKKVEKIIGSFSEISNPKMDEIAELTGLSDEALEKYLDELVVRDVLERTGEGTFRLAVDVEESG